MKKVLKSINENPVTVLFLIIIGILSYFTDLRDYIEKVWFFFGISNSIVIRFLTPTVIIIICIIFALIVSAIKKIEILY